MLYFISLISTSESINIDNNRIYDGMKEIVTSDEYKNYIGNSRENVGKVYGRFGMMKKLYEEVRND